MAAIVAVTVFPMVSAIIVATLIAPVVATVVLAITLMLPVMRSVVAVVPVVLHKQHPLTAGVVISAMLSPIFSMSWRNAQINWRTIHLNSLDHHWLTIDDLRLRIAIVAYIESAIETWLAYGDGTTHVGSKYGCCDTGSG